jgi:predicted amidohydrolase
MDFEPGAMRGDIPPWFPDYVALWYDQFVDEHRKRLNRPWSWFQCPTLEDHQLVARWQDQILTAPHQSAMSIDDEIRSSRDPSRLCYRALQAASDAIVRVGFPNWSKGERGWGTGWSLDSWDDIRKYWLINGRLNKGEGLLLPRRAVRGSWCAALRQRKASDPVYYVSGFVRWREDIGAMRNRGIAVRVVVPPSEPAEIIRGERPIRCAVVPIPFGAVEDELDLAKKAGARFGVQLKKPDHLVALAKQAISEAALAGAHIVVLPELCLTASGQSELGRAILQMPGNLWFVVAGTAATECRGSCARGRDCGDDQCNTHNRSVIFNSHGLVLLKQDKLFPYVMTADQIDRFGLCTALGTSDLREDTDPGAELVIMDTSGGRIAVLICEDLSMRDELAPIVDRLEIDLIVAPVMDGVQRAERWTARCATTYASEYSASVVVVTTECLAARHLEHTFRRNTFEEGDGIGLRARRWTPEPTQPGQARVSHKPTIELLLRSGACAFAEFPLE